MSTSDGAQSAVINPLEAVTPPSGVRPLIFHYHFFKNAGTSIDEMLQQNFGARWTTHEFRVPRCDNAAAVSGFVCSHPHLAAISSHTAIPPPPQIPGIEIFPIIFLRHPLDRLRSAFDFERQQAADTFGAQLARTNDFAGYVRELLNGHYRQARNFQTFCLARSEPGKIKTELDRALRALQSLPFVGLVEAYDESVARLESLLRPRFPHFRARRVHANIAPARPHALAERLDAVRSSLGPELYREVCAANMNDTTLYDWVQGKLNDVGRTKGVAAEHADGCQPARS
jgi:hypothetical protein